MANTAANQTGLIGTSGRAGREQDQLDFLAALAPHYGDDWWFISYLGWSHTEAGGQLTPSLKVKRAVVAKEFAAEIEALYA